jgi:HK97 family phage major capsid protein
MEIDQLRDRLLQINESANALRAKAAAENRDLTVDEENQLNVLLDDFDRVETRIGQLTKLEAQSAKLNKPAGRRTQAEQPAELSGDHEGNVSRIAPPVSPAGAPRVPATALGRIERNGGFHSLGDMALAVRRACSRGGATDPRLDRLASATTYGNEGSGTDGGFAIPPDFRTAIMETIMGEDSLLSRCDQITVQGNSFTCPVDETSPWQTTGGIQVTWDGEAAPANQSKPKLTERTVKLNKIRALVPMTEELLDDASAMDAYLRRKTPEKLNFAINLALINGSGNGQPMGALNAPCKVTVPKETNQQPGTIIGMNVFHMYNHMYGPLRNKAVWVINQEVEPQLFKLSIPGTDNTGNFATNWGGMLYIPPGGISGAPYGTIFGRPVIPTQACSALSTEGDILFINWDQYLAILKGGANPRVDVSMHLWFDQDLLAFRFILRIGGVPWWSQPLQPLNGSNQYSSIVSLGSR